MIEFEKFLVEKRDELDKKDPHRKYFEAQIELLGNKKLRPNQFHRNLIRKIIDREPLSWAPRKLPEPEVQRAVPKILYWMYGHDEDPEIRKSSYFNKGLLNSGGNLISFTQRPYEAAYYAGLSLRPEGTGALVVMLFPYEVTNHRRWVEDPAAHHFLFDTRIFLTDQKILRCNTLLVEYSRIVNADEKNPKNIQAAQYPSEIKRASGEVVKRPPLLPPEKQTREVIMDMFNITPEYQEEMLQLFR